MLCTCCCSIIIDFWSGGRHVELLVSFLPVGHFYQDNGRQNFLGIFFFTFALDLASPHLDKLVDKILFRTETVSSATFPSLSLYGTDELLQSDQESESTWVISLKFAIFEQLFIRGLPSEEMNSEHCCHEKRQGWNFYTIDCCHLHL